MRCPCLTFLLLACLASPARATELLRVFTWQGYVTADDLDGVNALLKKNKIDVRVATIAPYAEGPEQMYRILRAGRADVSFLTANYIQMQDGRTARQLQAIDPARLKNYRHVLPELRNLAMGMDGKRLLYVPFGGGAYGIWANMARVTPEQLPRRLSDLLQPRWTGHLSLTAGQVQPNVALAFMACGEPPFLLDTLVRGRERDDAKRHLVNSPPRAFLRALYGQVREFWTAAPSFHPDDWLVASYGPEISGRRARGESWRLVPFEEGNTVWLDTMNLHKNLRGKKLEAAYLFIDYMLSNKVQRRVVDALNMVAVSRTVPNPLLRDNPAFFRSSHFWPPYAALSDNLMRAMSEQALRSKDGPHPP